jgi:hypothetical protein
MLTLQARVGQPAEGRLCVRLDDQSRPAANFALCCVHPFMAQPPPSSLGGYARFFRHEGIDHSEYCDRLLADVRTSQRVCLSKQGARNVRFHDRIEIGLLRRRLQWRYPLLDVH